MVLLPERSVFMNELLIHPAAAFALIGVLMLILVGLYFRHVHLSTRTLVNMSLMLAITVVLHQIKLFHTASGRQCDSRFHGAAAFYCLSLWGMGRGSGHWQDFFMA